MNNQFKKDQFYRFKIGQFDCLSVSDGTYDYDPMHLFVGKTKEDVYQIMTKHNMPADLITSCLYWEK